jgi:hypothetical protein
VRAAGRFAVAVVAVTLVACGTSSPARLSRPQFTAQVNAMCARFDTEIKRALGADYTPPTPATFDRILDSASKAISKTEDLRPPADEAHAVHEWVNDFVHVLAVIRADYPRAYRPLKQAIDETFKAHFKGVNPDKDPVLQKLQKQIVAAFGPTEREAKRVDSESRSLGLTKCLGSA